MPPPPSLIAALAEGQFPPAVYGAESKDARSAPAPTVPPCGSASAHLFDASPSLLHARRPRVTGTNGIGLATPPVRAAVVMMSPSATGAIHNPTLVPSVNASLAVPPPPAQAAAHGSVSSPSSVLGTLHGTSLLLFRNQYGNGVESATPVSVEPVVRTRLGPSRDAVDDARGRTPSQRSRVGVMTPKSSVAGSTFASLGSPDGSVASSPSAFATVTSPSSGAFARSWRQRAETIGRAESRDSALLHRLLAGSSGSVTPTRAAAHSTASAVEEASTRPVPRTATGPRERSPQPLSVDVSRPTPRRSLPAVHTLADESVVAAAGRFRSRAPFVSTSATATTEESDLRPGTTEPLATSRERDPRWFVREPRLAVTPSGRLVRATEMDAAWTAAEAGRQTTLQHVRRERRNSISGPGDTRDHAIARRQRLALQRHLRRNSISGAATKPDFSDQGKEGEGG